MFSINDWHRQFQRQAGWTSHLREYIYDKISLSKARSILDVGCGTGVLEVELGSLTSIKITALDIVFQRLQFANTHHHSNWLCGDTYALPFADATFDISFCNYLLLWLKNPVKALVEIKRITCPGGYILLLAEPDYTHRIDFPEELDYLGKVQMDALVAQGANPGIGPAIGALLNQASIEIVETGLAGGQWNPSNNTQDSDLEWEILDDDLEGLTDEVKLQSYKAIDVLARKAGTRILYVPVFYAIGRIPIRDKV